MASVRATRDGEKQRPTKRDGEPSWAILSPPGGLEGAVRFSLDLSIDVLRRSPATLQTLLQGMGESWARGTEGPDTFRL